MPTRHTEIRKEINFRRQEEIFNPSEYAKEITIVGIGNIGSWTAVALTKLGLKSITLYDPDIVESHNLASQYFSLDDIGKFKVEALANQLKNLSDIVKIFPHKEKFIGPELIDDILIIAVDTMEERRTICKNIKEGEKIEPVFIVDARLGGPQLEIYTCRGLNEWESTFVDNPSVDSCGARYICYISMIVGALIANQIKRILKKEHFKQSILFHLDTLQLI